MTKFKEIIWNPSEIRVMNKAVAIFAMFMSLLFVALGILVMVHPQGLFLGLQPSMTYVLGSILIIYGIFRGYRAYKLLKQE